MFEPVHLHRPKHDIADTVAKSVFTHTDPLGSNRKKHLKITNSSILPEWGPDTNIYISWEGIPIGVPNEHLALRRGSSSALNILLPAVQIHRTMAWINYIWYNQQHFINHTIEALKLISEQLHDPYDCTESVCHRHAAWTGSRGV